MKFLAGPVSQSSTESRAERCRELWGFRQSTPGIRVQMRTGEAAGELAEVQPNALEGSLRMRMCFRGCE